MKFPPDMRNVMTETPLTLIKYTCLLSSNKILSAQVNTFDYFLIPREIINYTENDISIYAYLVIRYSMMQFD